MRIHYFRLCIGKCYTRRSDKPRRTRCDAASALKGDFMAATRNFEAGGYRYIPAVFQYSSGVAALPSYEIQRVTLSKPVPMKQGFRLIEKFIADAGRPVTAFCACELRSPVPFTPDGFKDFNKLYVETLKAWGIYGGGSDDNPVARSNVCPQVEPPAEPSLHAFSFTVK